MSLPLFVVEDLSIEFKSTHAPSVAAVDGINFSIFTGETLGIVGESGSGKTLTALAIMGLLPKSATWQAKKFSFNTPNQPEIALYPVSKWHQHLRGKSMGMVFQEPMTSLNPVMRCGDQIGEVIQQHLGLKRKPCRQAVLEWLERVKLDEPERIYQSYPHQISGGQKQRVMIALALCCQPQLLIADEPTTALDVTVQRHVLDLLKSLQKDLGTTILFISHDLGVIAEMADRIIVMQQGKIVEEGRAADLFSAAKHPYTQALLACRPRMDLDLQRLPTIQDFVDAEKGADPSTSAAVMTRLQKKEIPEQLMLIETPPLLEVQHLSTWFPNEKKWWGKPATFVKAVDQVSFSIYAGKTLGLVGESGSGKTTLGRSILRLIQPNGGACLFQGQDVLQLSEKELLVFRKKAQIIFQDPYASLNPRLPIGMALLEPMRVHGLYASEHERKEQVDELMLQVGLDPLFFDRLPHEFSGGQRQRIGIARALAVRPELIVCDECVSALDVSVQAQVLNLLKDLQEFYNLTYLFISHDLSVVKFMSDDIMVMQKGKMVEQGTARQVLENPQTEYTRQLIYSIPGKNL
jgi:peptide/nickel transport system ATP-binding protein